MKIKELKEIRPEKRWAKATKYEIMSQTEEGVVSKGFRWSFNPTFLAVPAALVVLAMGVFFYSQNVLGPEKVAVDVETLETIGNGLRAVESEIMKTTNSLEKIERPEIALELEEMISSTLQHGEQVVAGTRKMVELPQKEDDSPRVFTAISGVEYAAESLEYALQDMEETYVERQKELARRLIEDWEEKGVNEEQTVLFEEIKNDYNSGRFAEALAKMLDKDN